MNYPLFFKCIRKDRFMCLSSAWEAVKDMKTCHHDFLKEEEVPD
jgi:hypothetical protein